VVVVLRRTMVVVVVGAPGAVMSTEELAASPVGTRELAADVRVELRVVDEGVRVSGFYRAGTGERRPVTGVERGIARRGAVTGIRTAARDGDRASER
jgi:hypothetical protein